MSADAVEADGDEEPVDEADERPSSPTVDALETLINADTLAKTIDVADSVADESVLRFGRHGLKIRLVDPANVYMANIHLDSSGFEAVGDGVFPAGQKHEGLLDFIGKADSEELVSLAFDAETRRLAVEFQPYERDYALIDPDSIRQEPDIPDMDLPNVFNIDGETLKEVVEVSQLVSDHVNIEGDSDAECIRIVAEGDTDTNTATLDDELGFAEVTEDASSFLSLDYLEDAVGVIPKSSTVEVRFGDEFPVMMEWTFADDYGHVKQVIAPRIVSQ
jgi:proliferating cell nuclear antigen